MAQTFRRLSLNQRTTLLLAAASFVIGAGSLGVAIVSAFIAADSSDLKDAVRKLKGLNKQALAQTHALTTQVAVTRQQLETQRGQAASQAIQASSSQKDVATAISALAVSQRQLGTSIATLKIYKDQVEFQKQEILQRYRRIAFEIMSLALPEEVGTHLKAQVILTNLTDYPMTIEHKSWGIAVTPERPEDVVERLTAEAVAAWPKALDGPSALDPRASRQFTVTMPTEVSDRMISAVRDHGFGVLAYGAIEFRDPFGKVHHAYVCRVSFAGQPDQICGTRRGD